MNKQRRADIAEIIKTHLGEDGLIQQAIDNAKEAIESIRDEEQEYFDYMPESLQGGEKGAAAEEAVASIDEALDALDELDLDTIIDALNTAAE